VDVFQKLDSFLDNKVPLLLVVHFYIVSIPSIVTTVLPMSMLLSCLLALARSAATTSSPPCRPPHRPDSDRPTPLRVRAPGQRRGLRDERDPLPKLNAERNRIYKGDIKRENLEEPPCERIWPTSGPTDARS